MKIRPILFALLLLLTPMTHTHASPCSAVLCMFGMVAGGGSAGACASSTAEFFSIQVWDWWGFDPIATAVHALNLTNLYLSWIFMFISTIIAFIP